MVETLVCSSDVINTAITMEKHTSANFFGGNRVDWSSISSSASTLTIGWDSTSLLDMAGMPGATECRELEACILCKANVLGDAIVEMARGGIREVWFGGG